MSSARPHLRALADRLGVVDAYHELGGRLRETTDATREALCRAMGSDASDESSARRALEQLDARAQERIMAPVQVWREHDGLRPTLLVRPRRRDRAERLRIALHEEGGAVHEAQQDLAPRGDGGPVRVPLPVHPGPGRHRVRVAFEGDAGPVAEQWLVVAPRFACRVEERLGARRGFGVWTNLYALRSRRNAGIGDLTDLAALARACGGWGGDFVGLSPLHAIPNSGSAVSPYGPTSRLYRSPLYLDVEAVPEWADSEVRALAGAPEARRARARLAEADAVDYDAVRAWKLPLLRACHEAFLRRPDGPRAREYAAWRAGEGAALEDFATFEALDASLCGDGPRGDWRRWPCEFRDPASPAVARFRAQGALAIDFHAWLQFEVDRQLGVAAAEGREAGLGIGLYADLAVGSLPGSADTWSRRDQFAAGVSVGAPPDAFAAGGQNWGVAALHPHRMGEDGYGMFTRLLRSVFRHAGAIRIDHVIGLQRLFWIPEDRPAEEGAYVRYPLHDLLGVVALESRRHAALVVGEDLGTVPPGFSSELASFGILSSAVLAFEREPDGAFRPASRLSARVLASANTHDLAPLAGYLEGRDLALRREAGEPDADDAAARAARAAERAALIARLRADGVWTGKRDPGAADWCGATSAWLARSPAPLVAVSLDDLAGESEPVHLPGISSERHPSWRRRMKRPLETLLGSDHVRAGLPIGTLGRSRGGTEDS